MTKFKLTTLAFAAAALAFGVATMARADEQGRVWQGQILVCVSDADHRQPDCRLLTSQASYPTQDACEAQTSSDAAHLAADLRQAAPAASVDVQEQCVPLNVA